MLKRILLSLCCLFSGVGLANQRAPEAWQWLEQGAVLIDVRTLEEFQQGHLEGATLIPYQQIVAGAQQLGLKEDQAVVVYCRSGRRSGIAQQLLEQAGFNKVHNGGGLQEMQLAQP
ncbi:rhodanese-like domain-containing protein [Aliagarivorans taiwanensis]|uniref:rhodanese-like domain-containing protein n=1 Tax=Aliagarivorans taiwanensis TaxID=561966 RepID=UPI00041DBFD2|nr:rhodanese-like domain-containing protein [Aliagarivorans taiwanensis]